MVPSTIYVTLYVALLLSFNICFQFYAATYLFSYKLLYAQSISHIEDASRGHKIPETE